MLQNQYIRLSRPLLQGSRVSVSFECSQGVKAYLGNPTFWYECDSLGDLDRIPEGILVIPIVGNVATLAWALGAELRVDRLDATYAEALKRVSRVIGELYPPFRVRKSRIRVRELESSAPVKPEGRRRVGLLYSGGIDSLTSLIDNRDTVTDTISVWGVDVRSDNDALWNEAIMPLVAANPLVAATRNHVIRSNIKEGLSYWVNHDLGKYLRTGTWWGNVQHGLGLASLSAPLAFALGIDEVLIASTHSTSYAPPWGSKPEIDNNIAWATTSVTHDGFHRSRQQKISHVIAPFFRENGPLRIASCFQYDRGVADINCGICDKCARTQAGLFLEDIDLAATGFHPSHDRFGILQRRLTDGTYVFHGYEAFTWHEIQSAIPSHLDAIPDIYGSHQFFAWLRTLDFQSMIVSANRHQPTMIGPTHPLFFANRIGQKLPPPIQDRIKRRLAQEPIRSLLNRI